MSACGVQEVRRTLRVKEDVSIVYLDGRLIAGDAAVLYDAIQVLTSRGVTKILINLGMFEVFDSESAAVASFRG